MHTSKGRVLSVAAGAAVLVAGVNLASYAADGHAFLLGRHNTESATTAVSNTGAGPAFRFRTATGTPPFAVSSTAKVVHLNAARLGGLTAGDLSHTYRFDIPSGMSLPATFALSDLPAGRYTASFNAIVGGATQNGTPELCYVSDSRHIVAFGNEGASYEGFTLVNGSGLVNVRGAGQASFSCAGGGVTGGPGSGFRDVVVLSRVQRVTKGTTGPAPALRAGRVGRLLLGR